MTDEAPDIADSIKLVPVPSRPSAQEMFNAMTEAEQDAMLGPEVADAVRAGRVALSDLVVKQPMKTEDDFIAQATASDLGIDSHREGN